ncbi:FdhF/YdeP family oxidoreductase [soil metagenome]
MTDPALTPADTTPLVVTTPKTVAAGFPAVLSSLKTVRSLAGFVRGTKALLSLNQIGGVDCTSCAWPDPDHDRATAEFCENGAKAIAWETDTRRLTPEVFQQRRIADLAALSDYEQGQLGRLTHPMVKRPNATHYESISWDDAFTLIACELNALASPNEALFYTSGRASNEAAFLYQLFARQFGTNNLPDCSNMCHESSGKALVPTIGIGKGTVTLEDFEHAKLILILGQNPGTNHPRMLTALQKAKRAGAVIVAVNPLKEAGLIAFNNPQQIRGMLGLFRTALADHYLQIKIGGDQAFLKGLMKCLISKGQTDTAFVTDKTTGYETLVESLNVTTWDDIVQQSGLAQSDIELVAGMVAGTDRVISCWAMGLTQHLHAVATIQDVVNLHLLRGAIGKSGAGLCPVRGHSNVQGDRTMGIWEHLPSWADNLGREFGFTPPTEPGFDTIEAIEAMRDGKASVFVALGGNFLSATPDTLVTADALRNCSLTVQISIKLNRSHLVTGRTALILPCLGRTEQDVQSSGEQFITTENSMGIVQMSRGSLDPASKHLLSETAIIARLAKATLKTTSVPWADFEGNYDLIRDAISRVVPGFDDFNIRVRFPGGFALPNLPRRGEFASGKAAFTATPLRSLDVPAGHLVLMTIRTHDQFNTTVYGLHDRYRGLSGNRRVVLMNEADMQERAIAAGDAVTITSHFEGVTRVAEKFLVVKYDIPKGNCAAYFPEANVLVPLESKATGSHTPTSKWVIVTIAK